MKRRTTIFALTAILLVVLCFSACTPAEKTADPKSDIFRFEDYANDELFDIEPVALNEKLAAKCVSYQFTYLSDGYKIKGYISIPKSAIEKQEPVKCMLFNRGGNSHIGFLEDTTTAAICSVFDRVVIASQYRGGAGSEGTDQFGGDDVNDVIKLVDLCEKRFSFIDMDNFCAAGISRGGMMTYLAARRDSRIKRIIVVAGVSDLIREYDNREDMHDLLYECIGSTPQENPSEYEKRSAIYWTEEIKIPVLIIHSTEDAQVSYDQAAAMYEKLKDTTDCTLITHEDDLHDFHPEDNPTISKWLA